MPECPTCGDEMETERAVKTHHTIVHGESIAKDTYTCSGCGDTFERVDANVPEGTENHYCSMECRKRGNSSDVAEGDVECPVDGCNYTSSELGVQQHHKRTHGESLTETTLVCDECGSEFTRQRSKDKHFDATLCSEECKHSYVADVMSENRLGPDNPMYGVTGEDHHNYTGYDQGYGEGWLQARREALERDDYTCQLCGMTRDEHHEQHGRDLDVHHINPVRTFDDKSDAHYLDNLITMCKSCHAKAENMDDPETEELVV